MENIKKIKVTDEIANFIKNHNCISRYSEKSNKRYSLYWNTCKYLETDDVNVFEVIYDEKELLKMFVDLHKKNETENNI